MLDWIILFVFDLAWLIWGTVAAAKSDITPLSIMMYASIPVMVVLWVIDMMVQKPSSERPASGVGLCEDCVSGMAAIASIVINLVLFMVGGVLLLEHYPGSDDASVSITMVCLLLSQVVHAVMVCFP